VVGDEDAGQRPAQRADTALPAVRMRAERERDAALDGAVERARLVREDDR
jgi:hypothetical protein